MRDGIVLRADVYRPQGAGPWPVLLARTPYGKGDPGVLARLDPALALERGFLVVIQDVRGRFRSAGAWTPLANERTDGYDTVRWAARLPGSDGRVCMYGPSYLGQTQWAAVSAQPPELRAAVPEFTWSDPDDGLLSRDRVYELGLMTQWTLTLGVNVLERRHADDPAELERRLAALDEAIDGLTQRTYWETPPGAPLRRLDLPMPRPVDTRQTPITVPTLIVAGWYDSFLQGCLDNYARARDSGTPTALIVGPWTHDNQTGHVGDIDFGDSADAASIDAGASLLERELDWLDRTLSEKRSKADELPILLFVMGANRWRRLPSWPPACVETPWYLREDGSLSPAPPAPESPPDVFLHDPANPVPSRGGALLMTPDFPAGPSDQQQVEQRDDVLVYTSALLQAPLEVIGRVTLRLFADSTAPSTDWIARLCDVDEEGVSRNITDGVVRIDEGDGPGEVEVSIDLWSTAHVFLPGHRIRVQIASSCFPRWDRNFGAAAIAPQNPQVARQRVFHDTLRPSRLILPVLPSTPDTQVPMLRSSM